MLNCEMLLSINRVLVVRHITMYFGTKTSSQLMLYSPLLTIFATREFISSDFIYLCIYVYVSCMYVSTYLFIAFDYLYILMMQICKVYSFCFCW